MIRKYSLTIVLLWVWAAASSYAQMFHKGLFLDDYDLGYKGNPAVVYDKDVLSILDFSGNRQTNVGVRYVMPFHERLSTGLTASYLGYKGSPYVESRLCVAEKACDWFEVMGNAGYGSHGGAFGFTGVVSLPRFRINASMEKSMTRYIPGHRLLSIKPSFNVFSIGLTYDI